MTTSCFVLLGVPIISLNFSIFSQKGQKASAVFIVETSSFSFSVIFSIPLLRWKKNGWIYRWNGVWSVVQVSHRSGARWVEETSPLSPRHPSEVVVVEEEEAAGWETSARSPPPPNSSTVEGSPPNGTEHLTQCTDQAWCTPMYKVCSWVCVCVCVASWRTVRSGWRSRKTASWSLSLSMVGSSSCESTCDHSSKKNKPKKKTEQKCERTKKQIIIIISQTKKIEFSKTQFFFSLSVHHSTNTCNLLA